MLAVFLGTRQIEHTKIVPDSEEPTKVTRVCSAPMPRICSGASISGAAPYWNKACYGWGEYVDVTGRDGSNLALHLNMVRVTITGVARACRLGVVWNSDRHAGMSPVYTQAYADDLFLLLLLYALVLLPSGKRLPMLDVGEKEHRGTRTSSHLTFKVSTPTTWDMLLPLQCNVSHWHKRSPGWHLALVLAPPPQSYLLPNL